LRHARGSGLGRFRASHRHGSYVREWGSSEREGQEAPGVEMQDDTRDLVEAQRRVWEAANRRDVKSLEELLDADFVLVEADTLERKTKEDFLRETGEREGEEELLSFELANVKVQRTGDMAVCYAQFHGEEVIDGERLSLSGNAVDIFVRRDGAWKLLGSVYGEVPPFQE
jgi:ketosteroid isomerase-like protein